MRQNYIKDNVVDDDICNHTIQRRISEKWI